MPGFKILTEREMRDEFADMLIIYAEKGAQGLESHILAKGRNEMHQLLAYLFVRATMAEIDKTRLTERVNELEGTVSMHESDRGF